MAPTEEEGMAVTRSSEERKKRCGALTITCKVPHILHFEPSPDAFSLQSDVRNSIQVLYLVPPDSEGAWVWTGAKREVMRAKTRCLRIEIDALA